MNAYDNRPIYRVKYWRWINEDFGEWVITGLMSLRSAETVSDSLRRSHERVEIYIDRLEGEG